MKCRFRGAGGVGGGAQRPPQQHTRSKGEQLVLACLLVSSLQRKQQEKQIQKEKGEQLPKERKKDR